MPSNLLLRLFLTCLAGLAWGQDSAFQAYQKDGARCLVPLLQEAIRFPTEVGNTKALDAQKTWLMNLGKELGFGVRDAGPVLEIELPGPEGAPVLGLAVHGDVVPADPARWSFPPYAGLVKDGYVMGRGSSDDKNGIVQGLLAMKALADSGIKRTHTVRMLVGSSEESGSEDMQVYLKDHRVPDLTLVLDSSFPVVVGEKASNTLRIGSTSPHPLARESGLRLVGLQAGLYPSIVADEALLVLEGPKDRLEQVRQTLGQPMPETHLKVLLDGGKLEVRVLGRASHSGRELARGRNALVSLACVAAEALSPGQAQELLRFVRYAGRDPKGEALGFRSARWGGYQVNPGQIRATETGLELALNIRRPPGLTKDQARAVLDQALVAFNQKEGAALRALSFSGAEPMVFSEDSPIVQRLLRLFREAAGKRGESMRRPDITGSGSYAKAVPNAIPFGVWFTDRPYPGHSNDEKVAIKDLHLGTRILIHALSDLACGEPLGAWAFQPLNTRKTSSNQE